MKQQLRKYRGPDRAMGDWSGLGLNKMVLFSNKNNSFETREISHLTVTEFLYCINDGVSSRKQSILFTEWLALTPYTPCAKDKITGKR